MLHKAVSPPTEGLLQAMNKTLFWNLIPLLIDNTTIKIVNKGLYYHDDPL
jgi:hypothetical protein